MGTPLSRLLPVLTLVPALCIFGICHVTHHEGFWHQQASLKDMPNFIADQEDHLKIAMDRRPEFLMENNCKGDPMKMRYLMIRMDVASMEVPASYKSKDSRIPSLRGVVLPTKDYMDPKDLAREEEKGIIQHKVYAVPDIKHRCEGWLKTYQKIAASCTADHGFFVIRDIYGRELRPVPRTPARKADPGPKAPKAKAAAATRKNKSACSKQVHFDDACVQSPDPKRQKGSEQVNHDDAAVTTARNAMAGMDATVQVISNRNPNLNPALP